MALRAVCPDISTATNEPTRAGGPSPPLRALPSAIHFDEHFYCPKREGGIHFGISNLVKFFLTHAHSPGLRHRPRESQHWMQTPGGTWEAARSLACRHAMSERVGRSAFAGPPSNLCGSGPAAGCLSISPPPIPPPPSGASPPAASGVGGSAGRVHSPAGGTATPTGRTRSA